jgi:hypothetical protein
MSNLSSLGIPTTGRTPAHRAERIRRFSKIMSGLYLATSVVLTAGTLCYWVATPQADILASAGLPAAGAGNLGFPTRLLAFLVSMLPLAALIWGLGQARRCFDGFARQQFFTAETVGSLRAFAMAVFVSTLLQPFAYSALSLILTWTNPAGQRALAISISSDMLLGQLFAGTITVIAWVMREAIAIADENAQFV